MLHRAKALNESWPPARLSQTGKALGVTVFTESTAFAHRVKTLEARKVCRMISKVLPVSTVNALDPCHYVVHHLLHDGTGQICRIGFV